MQLQMNGISLLFQAVVQLCMMWYWIRLQHSYFSLLYSYGSQRGGKGLRVSQLKKRGESDYYRALFLWKEIYRKNTPFSQKVVNIELQFWIKNNERVMKVPAMYLKPVWTPLKWFGISVFKDQEDGRYYYKKRGGTLKRIGKAS